MKMYCLVQDGIIQGFAAFEENEEFDPSIWKLSYPEAKIGDVYNPNPKPDPTLNERVTTLESDNTLLKQQLKAASDQNDFLEDCIAEMAGIVYA